MKRKYILIYFILGALIYWGVSMLVAHDDIDQMMSQARQYEQDGRYEDAAQCYSKCAEKGDAKAQCSLGECYSAGKGVPQSDSEAVKWFRKSAEQGFVYGQISLAQCYNRGKGVPQNDSEAAKWLRKAAEQGNGLAQCWLGDLYRQGQGVPRSDSEAAKWYRMSAEQGNKEALDALLNLNAKQ